MFSSLNNRLVRILQNWVRTEALINISKQYIYKLLTENFFSNSNSKFKFRKEKLCYFSFKSEFRILLIFFTIEYSKKKTFLLQVFFYNFIFFSLHFFYWSNLRFLLKFEFWNVPSSSPSAIWAASSFGASLKI